MLLLAASLSIGAFVFSPLWLIPPVVAILLNIRIAMSMKDKTWKDVLFAASGIGAEVYMWLKAGHFVRAWTKFLSRVQTDNWAEQAKAERGSGNSHLVPLVVLAVVLRGARLDLVPAAGADPVLDPVARLARPLRRHHRPDRRDGRPSCSAASAATRSDPPVSPTRHTTSGDVVSGRCRSPVRTRSIGGMPHRIEQDPARGRSVGTAAMGRIHVRPTRDVIASRPGTFAGRCRPDQWRYPGGAESRTWLNAVSSLFGASSFSWWKMTAPSNPQSCSRLRYSR